MKLEVASRMKKCDAGIFQVLEECRKKLVEKGKPVINLSVGTPDFPPAKEIMEAVSLAAKKAENYKYSLTDLDQLLEAVQFRYKNRYGVDLLKTEIASVYGSQEGIAQIGFSLCNEGDVVLVPNPGYPIFSIGPSLANATLVTYDLLEENEYLPDLGKIKEDICKRARFMIVSYPLNPIGKTAPRSFYEELVAWAKKKNIIIVHDNAYSDIIFDGEIGESILSIKGAKENCLEFYSLSKTYNYTGARMAFLVGCEELVKNFKKLRSQIDYGIFYPVQYGAIIALTSTNEAVENQCRVYQERRDALCHGLTEIGWAIPDSEGTMFVWGKIPKGFTDDVEFVMKLMNETGVICTPGSSFGSLGKNHVRFALNQPVEVIKEAIELIRCSKILGN